MALGCFLEVREYPILLPTASAVVGCTEDGGRLAASVSFCDKAGLAVLEYRHIGSVKFGWGYLVGCRERNRLPALRSVPRNMEVDVVFTARHPASLGGDQNDGP